MSSINAELKCSHGRGKDINEPEAVTGVLGNGFGGGGKDYVEVGSGKDRKVLSASQTDLKTGEKRRGQKGLYGNRGKPSSHRTSEDV